MLAILDKMTQKCKRIYKKLYKIWTDKLCSLKFIAKVFLALVVTNFTETFKDVKKCIKHFLQLFETQWISTLYRSSHQRSSIKKVVLRNFTKFTGKQLCQSLFFDIKKEALAQVFSCEFCEIYKNTFFTEHLRANAFVSTSLYPPNFAKVSCTMARIRTFLVLSLTCILMFNL